MTTFTVFGHPATKGSTVSFLRRGRIITKSDCKTLAAWTQAVSWAARAADVPLVPDGGAVSVTATFQFVRPKAAKRRGWPTVRPDLDKLARALLDALTGVAYDDDSQVVHINTLKMYGPDARLTVTVQRAKE